MSESDRNSTILVVTEDVALLSSLLEGNTTDFQFISRKSMQSALEDPELLANNEIVILDIGSVNGGTPAIVDQCLKLKKSDPTQVLMIVGEQEPLGEILRSNIQPIIYRAFSKPIHPNQIFLAFSSASKLHHSLIKKQAAGEDLLAIGPLENRENVNTVGEQQKNRSLIYAGIAAMAMLVVGGVLFATKESVTLDQVQTLVATPLPQIGETDITNSNDDVTDINLLNQAAATALLEGRKVTPQDDNALYYYDQILAIDPYDHTAYEGKKALAFELKSSYSDLVDSAEFDKALQTITVLQAIEPLDPSNYDARQNLESEIDDYISDLKENGSADEIARMTTMMAKIGSQLQGSRSAVDALRIEQELLDAIDEALDQDNLIPPKTGNAYEIVSAALQRNQISNARFAPRLSRLSGKLIESAEQSLNQDDFDEAQQLTALAKRLGIEPQRIATLEESLKDRQTALAAEQVEETVDETQADSEEEVVVLEEQVEAAPVKVIPAKIISREPPSYPSRALRSDIEGWVSIGFVIDTEGIPQDIAIIDSQPAATFDEAAIDAVEKWRFSPAKNEETNAPVSSRIESTKLHFRITE